MPIYAYKCGACGFAKDYLQKILGYFLSGAVPLGRCFFIFYGNGKNGKSALIEVIQEIILVLRADEDFNFYSKYFKEK